MKKTRKFIAMLICVAVISAGVAPIVSADPSVPLTLEEQVAMLQGQVAALTGMLSGLMGTLEGMASMGQIDQDVIDRQLRDAELMEQHMFRMQYYGACMTVINNEMLRQLIDLTERQLEIERVQLSLGLTTQLSVDALSAQLTSLNSQLRLSNDALRRTQEHINIRRGRAGFGFIGDFGVPEPGAPEAESAEELRRTFIRRNVSLFNLDNQIRQMNEQGASNSQIQLMNAQRNLLVRQLELSANSNWSSYLEARANYNLAQAARPMLEARVALLDEMYRVGEISEFEWMRQRHGAYDELHRADMAAILLAMSIAVIDAMMNGLSV